MANFSLIVGLGASLGLWRISQNMPRRESLDWVKAGVLVLCGSLVVSRLVYVFIRSHYYAFHFFEAFIPGKGGLSMAGALIGGLMVMFGISRVWGVGLASVCERISPLLLPLGVAIWLGCWQAGCAYGQALQGEDVLFMVADESGQVISRVPLQIIAAFTLLLMVGTLEILSPYWESVGIAFVFHTFVFSLLRADADFLIAGLRLDTWVALVLLFICPYYLLNFRLVTYN